MFSAAFWSLLLASYVICSGLLWHLLDFVWFSSRWRTPPGHWDFFEPCWLHSIQRLPQAQLPLSPLDVSPIIAAGPDLLWSEYILSQNATDLFGSTTAITRPKTVYSSSFRSLPTVLVARRQWAVVQWWPISASCANLCTMETAKGISLVIAIRSIFPNAVIHLQAPLMAASLSSLSRSSNHV